MHFATLVLGAEPTTVIQKYGTYRDDSEDEHEDGKFDYAVPGGMFERAFVLARRRPRPKILGFLPAGYIDRCSSCELKELDLDSTLSGLQPIALASESEWIDLPEEIGSAKEYLKGHFAKLDPSTTVTVFDCHA